MTNQIESCVCVWLDKDAARSELHDKLQHTVSHLRLFQSSIDCDNYIRASTKEEILLVISDTFNESIVARLHDLPQLIRCYVLCRDQSNDLTWNKQYVKIKGVYKSYDELILHLIRDQNDRAKLEDSATITLIPTDSNSLQSRDAHFLWFLLYIEVLIRMHHSHDAKKELADMCRKLYADQPDELAKIERFEREYISEKAIWWYSFDSFLYRYLNKALRSRDFDALFALRFYISDLTHAIEHQYEQSLRLSTERNAVIVYRGQYASKSELKLMLDNVHQFISMNSFFSISRQRRVAISFLQQPPTDNNYQRVLFEITIDPRVPVKAFADIKEHSVFATEDEVLITSSKILETGFT